MTIAERFWIKVNIGGPYDCWLWTAARNHSGYGLFKPRDSNCQGCTAHRYAWILTHGPISSRSLLICHRCRNRHCVNPAHLYLGTSSNNQQDSIREGTFHAFTRTGVCNPLARFTEADVVAIRESFLSNAALGRHFRVNPSLISRVRLGVTYVTC